MKNKIKTIKEKCIEANPKIERRNNYIVDEYFGEIARLPITEDWFNFATEQVKDLAREVLYAYIQSPITLPDVLLAVKENKKPYIPRYECEECKCFLSEKEVVEEGAPISGYWTAGIKCGHPVEIVYRFLDSDIAEVVNLWNLKETLDNQSDECKNFLYDLLK